MAWKIDGRDIVINGFEKGISDSPYSGIADIRNANLISTPQEASVNFKTFLNSQVPMASISATGTAATDVISYSNANSITNGSAITFSASSMGGVATSTVYWAGNISGQTFKLYSDALLSSLVDISSDGTGTFTTVDLGEPKHWTVTPSGSVYFIDSNGRVWNISTSAQYIRYTGNTTLTNASGSGIVYYQASDGTGYIFAFRNRRIDYAPVTTWVWVYGWNPNTGGSGADSMNTGNGSSNSHQALVGQDNVVYYCDSSYIGSFFEKSGQTFDPTSTSTFTWAQQALALPKTETAQCLAELGINLLVGGARNFIYPWDRTSTSFRYPILVAEENIVKMVTSNTNTYIFAGVRGRIYVTNGSQAQLYKKVPDHFATYPDPLFTWKGAAFNRNQLYFCFSTTEYDQSTNPGTYGGVWAIDVTTDALRLVNKLSYDTYSGYPTLFMPLGGTSGSFHVGWYNGTYYGSDASFSYSGTTNQPYQNYETYVDTEILPVGQFLTARTFEQVEWKISKSLVSGDAVKISYRTNLTDSFTQIGETTTAGKISDLYYINFQNAQWLQLRIQTKATATGSSFARLTEVRIR